MSITDKCHKVLSNSALLRSVSERTLVIIALAALCSGVVFYLLFRQDRLPWLIRVILDQQAFFTGSQSSVNHFFADTAQVSRQASPLLDSLPSLIHSFATTMLVCLWCRKGAAGSLLAWLSLTLAALFAIELAFGFFSWLDLAAVLTGFGLAITVFLAFKPADSQIRSSSPSGRAKALVAVALIGSSSLLAMGSYLHNGYYTGECARYDESGFCLEYKRPGVPIYLTYQRLRESVALEPARAPDRIGRVYLYQQFVFLNERNEGIHVIDNSNPAVPLNLGFIRVPGNTELAIRGNYLYADSYVDLITLDLSDPLNIVVVDRKTDVFPWDAFQNVPNTVSFSRIDLDQSEGVVVSYSLLR